MVKWQEVLKLENSTILMKYSMMADKAWAEHRYNEMKKHEQRNK